MNSGIPPSQNRSQRREFQINFTVPTPPVQVEVAVHTAHEQYQNFDGPECPLHRKEHPEQSCNKAHGPTFDDDVENNV